MSGPNNLITSHEDVPVHEPANLVERAQAASDKEKRLPAEVLAWAKEELTLAQEAWNIYGPEARAASESFLSGGNALAKLSHFYLARQRLASATVDTFAGGRDVPRTLAGTPVVNTMHLTYVPWRQLLDVLSGKGEIPERWLEGMRAQQTPLLEEYGYGVLMDQVRVGSIEYRAPRRVTPDSPTGWIDGKGYLKKRMEEDGDWGVVLAQTGPDAGITGPAWQTEFEQPPEVDNQVTEVRPPIRMSKVVSELRSASISGVDISGLGIFEMTAITLAQRSSPVHVLPGYRVHDGRRLSMTEFLPANQNLFNHTVPQVRAEDDVLHWGTHYGENQLAVDAHMRLCVV